MKRVAIVQARLSSERLPRKALADIEGKPLVVRVLERTAKAKRVDEVVLATPDKELADVAEKAGFDWTIGPEDDVLTRYLMAANEHLSDVVFRITADCPLIDPNVIDECELALANHDYASNVLYRTFPKGLDVEVFPIDTLYRLDRLGKNKAHREHVTFHIYENIRLYDMVDVVRSEDRSDLIFCVDTEDELAFVRSVYARWGEVLDHREIIRLLEGDHGSAKPLAVAS